MGDAEMRRWAEALDQRFIRVSPSPRLPVTASSLLPISPSHLPLISFLVFNFGDHLHSRGDLQAANLYGC